MRKLFLFLVLCLSLVGCGQTNTVQPDIVTTDFPCYDIVRAITKDSDLNVRMLLKPGSDIHDYEPTPQDVIDMQSSKLLFLVGGESDSWLDDSLNDLKDTNIVKMMSLVDLKIEESVEGMEEEDEEEEEYDEHVWTDPNNVIKIIKALLPTIIKLDPDHRSLYEKNADTYIKELKTIDKEIKDIVSKAKRKEIVIGDRFPMRYFCDAYGLKYHAAFPGCSESTEASAKTISYLCDYVKNHHIPVIFKIEMSQSKIADTISQETGAKLETLQSAHTVSADDFEAGITYIDLYKENIKVLKEALY